MGVEAGSTNRWRTARERNRLRARYVIQSRIASHVNDDGGRCLSPNPNEGARARESGNGGSGDGCDVSFANKDGDLQLSLEEANSLLRYLRAIINNDLSAFSVASLARDAHLLNGPIGAILEEESQSALAEMLSTALPWKVNHRGCGEVRHPQPTTLATSKYGTEYVSKRLAPYMQFLADQDGRQLTFVEYASLLGRHGIVALMLLGGLDPTISSNNSRDWSGGSAPVGVTSKRVLALLHSLEGQHAPGNENEDEISSKIPLSMWCYMIRAVVEMRMNGALKVNQGRRERDEDGDLTAVCSVCQLGAPQLQFGPPCRHAFCESCMWNHLADTVPFCDLKRNVVTCPCCEVEFGGFQCHEGDRNSMRQKEKCERSTGVSEEKDDDHILSIDSLSLRTATFGVKGLVADDGPPPVDLREQRRLESLAKFMQLPANAREMKSSQRKRRKERDPAHATWEEALRPTIQGSQTRDIRTERFFRAVLSSPHLLLGYLMAGVDVNVKNVYGQTALYVACWKGPLVAVRLLLGCGADAMMAAQGGSTCYSVAAKHERQDVLHLLSGYDEALDASSSSSTQLDDAALNRRSTAIPQVSVLIDPAADHPGAGACIVDNAVSEDEIQQLVALWQSLPTFEAGSKGEAENAFVPSTDSESRGKSSYRPSRSYYCDAEERVQKMLEGCVRAARMALTRDGKEPYQDSPLSSVFKHLRFLNYSQPGGILPPHVDLCRVDDETGLRSTHTFILYLTNCEEGGGTALLNTMKNGEVLAVAQPRRGRALIFPHLCPHSGLETVSPKLLLRGEVLFCQNES